MLLCFATVLLYLTMYEHKIRHPFLIFLNDFVINEKLLYVHISC